MDEEGGWMREGNVVSTSSSIPLHSPTGRQQEAGRRDPALLDLTARPDYSRPGACRRAGVYALSSRSSFASPPKSWPLR
jgi:hypothetical protein